MKTPVNVNPKPGEAKGLSIVEQQSRFVLSCRDFRVLSAALEQAFSPNEALREALDSARETVHRA